VQIERQAAQIEKLTARIGELELQLAKAKKDSNRLQNPRENTDFQATGFYSGGHCQKVGSDAELNEWLAIYLEADEPARRELLALARNHRSPSY
jgi:hypothetical protein